jgi:hypothetical protein
VSPSNKRGNYQRNFALTADNIAADCANYLV